MKRIKLTQGKFALVDNEDFEFLNQWNWHLSSEGYAARYQRLGFREYQTSLFMHRILNKTPKGTITDHINRNRLDNRKKNLKTSNKSKNAINSKVRVDNTSGHKGVTWVERRKRWMAQIDVNTKHIGLGYFKEIKDAIIARRQAALKYHKEYALH